MTEHSVALIRQRRPMCSVGHGLSIGHRLRLLPYEPCRVTPSVACIANLHHHHHTCPQQQGVLSPMYRQSTQTQCRCLDTWVQPCSVTDKSVPGTCMLFQNMPFLTPSTETNHHRKSKARVSWHSFGNCMSRSRRAARSRSCSMASCHTHTDTHMVSVEGSKLCSWVRRCAENISPTRRRSLLSSTRNCPRASAQRRTCRFRHSRAFADSM